MNTPNNTHPTHLSARPTRALRSTLLIGLALMGTVSAFSPAFAADKIDCELRDSLGKSDKNSVEKLTPKECKELGGKEVKPKKD